MGTRSKIFLNSKNSNKSLVLYKHHDGYPSDNLKMLLEAFQASNDIEGMAQDCSRYYERENMVEVSDTHHELIFNKKGYVMQGDLEYIYIVDVDGRNIDVYGGGYGDEKELYALGKFNPIQEADSYRDGFQEPTRAKIAATLTSLAEIQVTVNKGVDDSEILKNQLIQLKKSKIDIETKLYEEAEEKRQMQYSIKAFTENYFSKMTASQLKTFFEISGLKIKKVTKCKGERSFNVYLDKNDDFQDLNRSTPWQHLNSLAHLLNLNLEIK